MVQLALLVMLTKRTNVIDIIIRSTAYKSGTLQSYVFLKSRHRNPTTKHPEGKTVLILISLKSAAMPTDVTPTFRPTYELCISYWNLMTNKHTAECHVDTEASLNLVQSEMIPQEWTGRVEKNNLLPFRTVTRQSLTLAGLILSHHRLGDLRTRVSFGVAPLSAVNLLLSTPLLTVS